MTEENNNQNDSIAVTLRSYAQMILVIIFGLLPLIFVPKVVAPFEYTKVLVVFGAVSIALVLYSFSVLRSGSISFSMSYPLIALWVTAGTTFISGLLSDDFKDSLIGDLFSIHSAVFVVILALIPTVWMILRPEKSSVMRMYVLLATSVLVLVIFHIARLFFGTEFLSFGIFTNTVSTPAGSWNDLALLLGLTVILSLVALEQLTLSKAGKMLFGTTCALSLVMLAVINFFTVWLVLGLGSLVMIVYILGKDRFSAPQLQLMNTDKQGLMPLFVGLLVFATSVVFIVGGSSIGGFIAKYTNVTYVEVRPSFQATLDIARNVYQENAFLGIGANKFVDAWRLYKDNSINLTTFWNTDFNAGNGYITTFFVTTGVLGGIAWLVFLITYFVTGIRRLMDPVFTDKTWYFIAVSSFVSALYVWSMSIIYVPGIVILLFGSMCTGVSLYAFSIISGKTGKTVSVGVNRRSGFILTLVVIVVIISSVSAFYMMGRHYSAVYTFNQSVFAIQNGESIDVSEGDVLKALQLSESDVFARGVAELQLRRMNDIMILAEVTETDRANFKRAYETAISAGRLAVRLDESEPANWAILGTVYGTLATLQYEGAQAEALKALEMSRRLNPKNPLPYLESAIIEGRQGNIDQARKYIQESIALKPNFTEAFYYLSQLEIAVGNVAGAVKSTQNIINLEPQNPARYYQLGVLESAQNNLKEAIAAFNEAVDLDPNYANARYLLALAYDMAGEPDAAKEELRVVLSLNPGNADVTRLISIIESEGSLASLRKDPNQSVQETVAETTPSTEEDGTVTTTGGTKTDLVTPVNTIPNIEEEIPTE
jgi:tetratricopeptide (TPR) repeat protein